MNCMDEDKDKELIVVEVAYGTPQKQRIYTLTVPRGTSAFEAVLKSGISREFPDIDVNGDAMGIFSIPMDGKSLPLPAEYELENKDRVEIYRPLLIDPKQARLQRAERKEEKRVEQKGGNKE